MQLAGRRPEGFLLLALGIALARPLGGLDAPEPPPPGSSPHGGDALLRVFLSTEGWSSAPPRARTEAAGGRIRAESFWLRPLGVEAPPGSGEALAVLDGVLGVRPVARFPLPPPLPVPGSPVADSSYGELGRYLDFLDVPGAHALGFSGAGIRVGILGGTFQLDHPALASLTVLATRDFVDGDLSVTPDPQDPPRAALPGTALWSLVGGDLPPVLRAPAPGASFLLARVHGLGETSRADEDRWVAGLEWLESQGAQVVLSGVTFRAFPGFEYPLDELDGDRTPATRAADEAARRGILVVVPVGNRGPGASTLESPADGDSVLAVGAVDSLGARASFSSRGPTGDGRDKPEVLAPGVQLPGASPLGEGLLERMSGTEFAAALVAGAAALFLEAHPDRGPMEVMEALRLSAPDLGLAFGGVPRLSSALLFPDGIQPFPVQEVGPDGKVLTLAPTFSWDVRTLHPLGLPVTFHLQLSPDSLFREVALQDSVTGAFSRVLSRPLPPRTRLFWRVEARSPQGIRGSSAAEGPLEVPPWVALEVLNDPAGAELGETQPDFRWRALPLPPPAGPLEFELQILSDRDSQPVQTHPGLQGDRFRLPEPLPLNVPLRWRIIARARDASADTVTSAGPFVVTSGAQPPITLLYQNFPNPFPDRERGVWETRIWFDLAEEGRVELAVYDLRGRLVRRLIPGPGCPPLELERGLYGREAWSSPDPCVALRWDGRDDRGREVSRGVYVLRLRAGGTVGVRRIVYWP